MACKRQQEFNERVFFSFFSLRVQIVGRREETIPSVGSSMKEDVN